MPSEPPPPPRSLELLYPFYLDSDMSMAFAAALAGGVALESEQVDRSDQSSQAVKNLRGNLRAFSALGIEAGREATEGSVAATESRLIRRHTDASIFIDLYDELRRTGRIVEDPGLDDIKTGDIVSAHMGPAVAPLRRIVDQVIRLLDLTMPVLAAEAEDGPQPPAPAARQRKKHGQRPPRPAASDPAGDDGMKELRQLHKLFIALRDDLEHSGMMDIAVTREDAPSVVITLDKRFISEPAVELLHTSAFTIVGKVTNVWSDPDDMANLYRRSVVSLLPPLVQTVGWGILMFLGSIARGIDTDELQQLAYAAAGIPVPEPSATGNSEGPNTAEVRASGDESAPGPGADHAAPSDEEALLLHPRDRRRRLRRTALRRRRPRRRRAFLRLKCLPL